MDNGKGWVRVSERYPTKEETEKNHGWFLVYWKQFERIEMDRFDGFEEERSYEHNWKKATGYYVTHWRELPERPNE